MRKCKAIGFMCGKRGICIYTQPMVRCRRTFLQEARSFLPPLINVINWTMPISSGFAQAWSMQDGDHERTADMISTQHKSPRISMNNRKLEFWGTNRGTIFKGHKRQGAVKPDLASKPGRPRVFKAGRKNHVMVGDMAPRQSARFLKANNMCLSLMPK